MFRLTVIQNHHWNAIRTRIFDKARTAMTVLTNLEVTRILYHSRLAVEAKTGKKIPELSRIENVFSKQFRFINISFINSALAI